MSHVERPSFRNMISTAARKFNHISRGTVRSDIVKRHGEQLRAVEDTLRTTENIALTVDIWSDRRIRSYMGITAHFIEAGQLTSAILCCQQFHGEHTGVNIKTGFDEVLHKYGITDKVSYVISDHAKNMVKAFSVPLLQTEEPTDEEVSLPDNEDLFEDTEDLVVSTVIDFQAYHLRCFAHSLQLCVADGLKETRNINQTLAKCCKLASSLHQSTHFVNAFQKEFGHVYSIPQPNSTRWNSTLTHIRAILKLDQGRLARALKDSDKGNLVLSAKDLSILDELITLLDPFMEATNATQGDKQITISYVAPCVLQLRAHLESDRLRIPYCTKLRGALTASLGTRFKGIFDIVSCIGPDSKDPFSHEIYSVALLLDPSFGPKFLDFRTDSELRVIVNDRLRGVLAGALETIECLEEEDDDVSQRPVTSGLFSDWEQEGRYTSGRAQADEVGDYFRNPPNTTDAIKYWTSRENTRMGRLALRVLCCPATSAPVERVFSSGGIIFSNRRRAMAPELLEKMFFLKCNRVGVN